jgi:hypothetical protein
LHFLFAIINIYARARSTLSDELKSNDAENYFF